MNRTTQVLAWLATGLAAIATAAGLVTDAYRDAPAMVDQALGADLATLLVAVPLLILALRLGRSGSPFARVSVAAVLAYLVYTYAIFAFQVVFNPLTPLYIAILGLSAWALAIGTPDLLAAAMDHTSEPRLLRRTTSGFLALIVLAFAGMWLGQIASAIGSGGVPEAVVDLDLPTSGVYALDLAFVLPVFAMASVRLARRAAGGQSMAFGCLVFSVLMALSIVGALWVGAARGAVEDPVVPVVFAVITVVAAALAIIGIRPSRPLRLAAAPRAMRSAVTAGVTDERSIPRLIAAVVIGAHGLIHLIGFGVAWGLLHATGVMSVSGDGTWIAATRIDVPALNGSLVLGDAATRIVGIAWLAVGVGFVLAATGIERGRPWVVSLVVGLAIVSTALCALWLPDAAAGILVDLGILGAVAYVLTRTRRTVVQ